MKFEINLSARNLDKKNVPVGKTTGQVYCDLMNESNEIFAENDLHRILYAMKSVCEFRCSNKHRLNSDQLSRLAVLQYRYEQRTLELIRKLEENQKEKF